MNILHFIQAGGWIMYPLLALSLAAGAVIIERVLAFRQLGNVAPGLLPRVIALCENSQYDEALQECRAQNGPVASCLAVVLEHRGQPVARVERWVEEAGQEYFIRLERMLPFLDTTTTISPLMGLLGTIIGMIGAFNAISAQKAGGSTDAVLGGVAEALYATATGITIAVICFIAYNYFASRARNIAAETEMAATKLINVLSERHFDAARSDAARAAVSGTAVSGTAIVGAANLSSTRNAETLATASKTAASETAEASRAI